MKLSRLGIATQVLSDRRSGLPRASIIQHLKRRLKGNWNRGVIELIDHVIKHRALPAEAPRAIKIKDQVVASLVRVLSLRKRGKSWGWSGLFPDLPSAQRKKKSLAKALNRAGFRYKVTRGDVGLWTDGFKYKRKPNVDLTAGITLDERRRPYGLRVDIASVRDFFSTAFRRKR